MLTKKSIFEEVGGFDEENLATAYNDVDYCFRVREAGYRIMYQPEAVLYHYESASRGKDMWQWLRNPRRYVAFRRERAYLRARWHGRYFS